MQPAVDQLPSARPLVQQVKRQCASKQRSCVGVVVDVVLGKALDILAIESTEEQFAAFMLIIGAQCVDESGASPGDVAKGLVVRSGQVGGLNLTG